jgi:hypothetical protein
VFLAFAGLTRRWNEDHALAHEAHPAHLIAADPGRVRRRVNPRDKPLAIIGLAASLAWRAGVSSILGHLYVGRYSLVDDSDSRTFGRHRSRDGPLLVHRMRPLHRDQPSTPWN